MEKKLLGDRVETPKEIVKQEPKGVDAFISQAISQSLPVETMERLFALREKVRAEESKEAFTQALANFQKDCPIIEKNKIVMNKDGRTVRYKYASLDNIVTSIKDPLSRNGLAYNFDVQQTDGKVKAIAIVTHIYGHSERTPFEIPIDKDGFMTEPQKYASALTFGKRYALCNALGILTGEEDTDATDVGKEKTPKDAKSKIVFLLRGLGCETKTKEEYATAVKQLCGLELNDTNLVEIHNRLEVLLRQKNEDNQIQ